jgi:hypothetical protein
MNEFEIITHIHTDASSGAASALDLLVTESIRSVLGPDYESRWKECFNRPEDLCATLRPMGPVSMVFLTDHINEKYHRHSPDALELAARDERVAVGAEIQTFYRDGRGNVCRAPEVLVYGRRKKTSSGRHRFFGVSQEDLDILFRECCVDETGRADIGQVRDYCILNGYAHALAHPFDGPELSLPDLLDVISDFKFVETVNGGFPADSSLRLSRFVSWYNKAASGLIDGRDLGSPLLGAMHRKALERGPIHPWGGSDAHAKNHDRVVVLYCTDRPDPTPGLLFADMVGRSVVDLLRAKTFFISGTPATAMTLLDDLTRIAYQNVLSHLDLVRDGAQLLEMVAKVRAVTSSEVRQRRLRKKALIQEFDETLGPELRLGLITARRQLRRMETPDPLDAGGLPERIP